MTPPKLKTSAKCPDCGGELAFFKGVCAEHNQQLVYCTNPDCWLSYVVGCDTYLRNSKSSVTEFISPERSDKK